MDDSQLSKIVSPAFAFKWPDIDTFSGATTKHFVIVMSCVRASVDEEFARL